MTLHQIHDGAVDCHCGDCDHPGYTRLYRYFMCPTCKRLMPWCWGAANGRPDDCDDCWLLFDRGGPDNVFNGDSWEARQQHAYIKAKLAPDGCRNEGDACPVADAIQRGLNFMARQSRLELESDG
jgi:hypothetical protein